MRKISNVFLNGVEVSAQEASYGVLGIPLTNSSRDCIFIPTGPPDERIIFVKTENELRNLDSNSTDIAARGLLDHYIQRPDEVEDISLAEFAAWYTYSSRKSKALDLEIEDEDVVEVKEVKEPDEQVELPKFMRLKDKTGYIRKRKTERIIRFRRYGEKEDPENYCREQIMLYHPWRNEDLEISNIDHREKFRILQDQIRDVRKKFNSLEVELSNVGVDSDDSSEDEVDEEYAAMGGYEEKADIMQEIFQDRNDVHAERIPVPLMMDDNLYYSLIQSLNTRQEQYLCHVIEALHNERNLTEFVYGGAGKEE
jgi:hypothetical protein